MCHCLHLPALGPDRLRAAAGRESGLAADQRVGSGAAQTESARAVSRAAMREQLPAARSVPEVDWSEVAQAAVRSQELAELLAASGPVQLPIRWAHWFVPHFLRCYVPNFLKIETAV